MSAPEKQKNGNGNGKHQLAVTKEKPKGKKRGRKPKVTAEMKRAIVEAVERGVPIELQCLALDITQQTLNCTMLRDRQFRVDVACARVRLADELIGKLRSGDRSKDYSRLPWLMSKLLRDFADKPAEAPAPLEIVMNQSIEAGALIFDKRTMDEIRSAEAEALNLNRKGNKPNASTSPARN